MPRAGRRRRSSRRCGLLHERAQLRKSGTPNVVVTIEFCTLVRSPAAQPGIVQALAGFTDGRVEAIQPAGTHEAEPCWVTTAGGASGDAGAAPAAVRPAPRRTTQVGRRGRCGRRADAGGESASASDLPARCGGRLRCCWQGGAGGLARHLRQALPIAAALDLVRREEARLVWTARGRGRGGRSVTDAI